MLVATKGRAIQKVDRFFSENRQAAAVLKHGVLERYLARFAGMVGSTSQNHRVGYLDGFAGSGVYENPVTGRVSPGSPQIALNIAAGMSNCSIECVFVEKNKAQFVSLERVVQDAGYTGARALKGDVRKHLDESLALFADMPLLVFLDPFGTALETQAVVDRILNRPGTNPTELLLNFSIDSVRRIGARFYEPEDSRGRENSLARLDSWLGGEWWRAHFAAAVDADDRASVAADAVFADYVTRVNQAARCGSFAVPIRRQAHHKPIFNLTLFFHRNYAVLPFNEAVSKATEGWRTHLHDLDLTDADLRDQDSPRLPGMTRVDELKAVFVDDEAAFKEETIQSIVEAVRAALVGRSSLSVRNDFQLVFGSAIGAGREMHLRAAWKRLADEGLTDRPPSRFTSGTRINRLS
jgi:three-Cys-motif partner protein